MKKKIAALLCVAAMLVPSVSVVADYEQDNLTEMIVEAVEWKDNYDNPFYSIGSNGSNLYITALRRLGAGLDYESYLSGLDGIAAGYGSEHNAADMQRTVLAVISSYGDAQNVGGRDLVADSTYNRDAAAPLVKDGCDGLSWALIALEAGSYEVPADALESKDQIIAALLSYQNSDGSFGKGVMSTSAAVTALAPYIETSGAYTITQNQTGQTMDISPSEAVESAVVYLSEAQMKDGDWGDANSTAMTIIALDTLGIDCESNPYFSARSGNAVDGLLTYRNSDGGFSENGGESDGEATSYALCALTSHLGFKQGRSGFFRLDTGETVVLVAPPSQTAPPQTTAAPTPSQDKSDDAETTERPAATTRPAATARPAVTPRPAATARPSSPTNTMRPTRTAAPAPSTSPMPRSTARPTPRPTRRPALVGPVEIPGPMPTETPQPDIRDDGGSVQTIHKSGAGTVVAIVLSAIALLLIASFVTLTVLKKKGKLKSDSALGKLMGVKPEPTEKEPARVHRRTEERRKFEQRERYKERLKYRHRS